MLSENGLMLYEASANGNRRPSATHPLARITCASDDAPKSDSLNRTETEAIYLVEDQPKRFFSFGEGGKM